MPEGAPDVFAAAARFAVDDDVADDVSDDAIALDAFLSSTPPFPPSSALRDSWPNARTTPATVFPSAPPYSSRVTRQPMAFFQK